MYEQIPAAVVAAIVQAATKDCESVQLLADKYRVATSALLTTGGRKNPASIVRLHSAES